MKSATASTLGDRLKAGQQAARVSAPWLAQQLQMKLAEVMDWENGGGVPPQAVQLQLCRLLGVRPLWLLDGAGSMRSGSSSSGSLAAAPKPTGVKRA